MLINKLLEFVENVGNHIQLHEKEEKESDLLIVTAVNQKRKSGKKKEQMQKNSDKLQESKSRETNLKV